MEKVEIWPQEIEGGDARVGGIDHVYLPFTDPEAEKDVYVFLNNAALEQIRAMLAADGRRH